MEGGPAAGREIADLVGRRLRALRQAAGLTIGGLGNRSGVSRRMIVLVEQGAANPSLGTLDKLARGLGVEFTRLVAPQGPDPLLVSGPESAPPVWSDGQGSRAWLRAASRHAGTAELWIWELAPGVHYQAEPDPAGTEELLLVLAGELELTVAGAVHRLAVSGSARLPSDANYAYANPGPGPLRFVRVVITA